MEAKQISIDLSSRDFHQIFESTMRNSMKNCFFENGRGRIRPQIGPLTFLKIFVLEIIYSGRSQHSEPSYGIFNTSLYYWG